MCYQEGSAEEIEQITPDELCQAGKQLMESNCWEACKDLRVRVNDAPAPTRGYIHRCASERKTDCFSLIRNLYNHSSELARVREVTITPCFRSFSSVTLNNRPDY